MCPCLKLYTNLLTNIFFNLHNLLASSCSNKAVRIFCTAFWTGSCTAGVVVAVEHIKNLYEDDVDCTKVGDYH